MQMEITRWRTEAAGLFFEPVVMLHHSRVKLRLNIQTCLLRPRRIGQVGVHDMTPAQVGNGSSQYHGATCRNLVQCVTSDVGKRRKYFWLALTNNTGG